MNYCVLGVLIEQLAGQDYEQAVSERLLTPLGITGMRLAPTHDPGPGEVVHRSVPGRNYMEVLGAAGAWVASPSDLLVIFDSLDPDTPGWKPLDADTVAAALVCGLPDAHLQRDKLAPVLMPDGLPGSSIPKNDAPAIIVERPSAFQKQGSKTKK
mgnify:CR=1 FL=1